MRRWVLITLLFGCHDTASLEACTVQCSAQGGCPVGSVCSIDGYCHGDEDGTDCVPPDLPDAPDAALADPPDAAAPEPDGPLPCTGGDINEVNPATGHCYIFYVGPAPWANAQTRCQGMGAHLVTLGDGAENTFVIQEFVGTRTVWTGATDSVSESTWRWITDETWAYTAWNYGEPNNANGGEDCGVFDGIHGMVWDDRSCGVAYSYICERDP